jgi:hypothetical protein
MLVLAGDAAEAVVSADVERDESVGFERLREREQGCGASAAQMWDTRPNTTS